MGRVYSLVGRPEPPARILRLDMTTGPVPGSSSEAFQDKFRRILTGISSVILGQGRVFEELLVAALARGHVLVEGVRGLGKRRRVTAFAGAPDLAFARVQCPPALMPAVASGTTVFVAARQRLATQNPLEMEGTYPLPEAQLDRFMFKILVSRPDAATLRRILVVTTGSSDGQVERVFDRDELLTLQRMLRAVPIADAALDYVVRLVEATHEHPYVRLGASPRGAQAITLAAKGFALAAGRPNVELDDIRRAVLPALRHRLMLSFEAEVEGVDTDAVLQEVLGAVEKKR